MEVNVDNDVTDKIIAAAYPSAVRGEPFMYILKGWAKAYVFDKKTLLSIFLSDMIIDT